MNTLFDVDEVLDTVIHGDALEVLKNLPDECIDAIACDPPAGINFMNKDFDKDRGGRAQWVAWLSSIMREARRCLCPGGHALVWALPRTSHWTALALEDAGFEIRDCLYNLVSGDTALHTFIQSLSEEQQNAFMQVIDQQRETSGVLNIFGQGFPKSLSVDKAIDKHLGKEREILGWEHTADKYDNSHRKDGVKFTGNVWNNGESGGSRLSPITKPATPESEAWSGWGSNLKPACENWWLVRKPLASHSIAENVLEYGTGGLNIDATRIGYTSNKDIEEARSGTERMKNSVRGEAGGGMHKGWQRPWMEDEDKLKDRMQVNTQGRFPSHLLLSHTIFCQQSGTKRVQANGPSPLDKTRNSDSLHLTSIQNGNNPYRDEDGMETVTNWICDDLCPVKILDLQSGTSKSRVSIRGKAGNAKFNGKYHNGETYTNTVDQLGGYSDSGGPSRYFQQLPALDDVPPYIYAGKASRKDRSEGLEGLPKQERTTQAGKDRKCLKCGKWYPLPMRLERRPNSTCICDDPDFEVLESRPAQNTHPTVKSVHGLMRYLVRLVTPPNGIVLDMFAGSGSTGVACIHEGFHYILVEKELEYINIARARIEHALATVGAKPQPPPAKSPTLLRPRHKTTNTQPTLWDKEIDA